MNKTSDLKRWRREYYLANRDKQKAQSAAYKKRHPEVAKKSAAKRRAMVINHYGGKCSCCGEGDMRFLTIDHLNNDGCKLRSKCGTRIGGAPLIYWIIKNNFPEHLAVMCWNCNSGRHYNGGICPHKS